MFLSEHRDVRLTWDIRQVAQDIRLSVTKVRHFHLGYTYHAHPVINAVIEAGYDVCCLIILEHTKEIHAISNFWIPYSKNCSSSSEKMLPLMFCKDHRIKGLIRFNREIRVTLILIVFQDVARSFQSSTSERRQNSFLSTMSFSAYSTDWLVTLCLQACITNGQGLLHNAYYIPGLTLPASAVQRLSTPPPIPLKITTIANCGEVGH